MNNRTILVIGANGALGQQIVQQLELRNVNIVHGIYNKEQLGDAARFVDVNDASTINAAIKGIDVVVVAVRQREPLVQKACVAIGIPCIDVTVEYEFSEKVRDACADSTVPLVMMCGFFPGLSGVLAESLASQFDEVRSISVGLLQNTNAKVGATGVADMLRKITQPITSNELKTAAFSQTKKIDFGYDVGEITTRMMPYDERIVLFNRYPGAAVEYYTAWNNKAFTRLIYILQKTKLLTLLLNWHVPLVPKHDPTKPQTVHLTTIVTGAINGIPTTKAINLRADSDYVTTARFVAAAVQKIGNDSSKLRGVVFPLEFVKVADVMTMLGDKVEYRIEHV